MGLIADIAESFRGIGSGFADGFKTWQTAQHEENIRWKNAIVDAATLALDDPPLLINQQVKQAADFLADGTGWPINDPLEIAAELFRRWDRLLRAALDQLNVDAEPAVFGPQERVGVVLSRELAKQSTEASVRVSVAVSAVNTILATGTVAAATAELFSVGIVRSVSDAIQSWVWANGIGGLTSLAYGPQLQASVGPWLERHYNARSEAKLPGTGDLIRFQLREVWQAGRREELLDDSDRSVFEQFMSQSGYDKYTSDSYWAAHWVLPPITQLNEMLHRGVIDQATWQQFVRYNDYEPASIPRLQEIIYSPYSRVDARRMHRMGVLNDEELLQAYADIGYYAPTERKPDGKMQAVFVANPDFTVHKAQALVVFTKVFNALPELRQRFRRGHISEAELLTALTATGIPAPRAQALWETIVNVDKPERVEPEKRLTRGLIARAWKLQIIGFNQALFLLQRLGWSRAEADLILRVQLLPDFPGAFTGSELGARLTDFEVPMAAPSVLESPF